METELSLEHLTTIAEVAIAVAGFSTLVALLSVRSGIAHPRADAVRLQLMLEASLLVVAFSLFPFIPSTLGASSDLLWRISSGTFLIVDATFWIATYRRNRAVRMLLTTTDRRLAAMLGLASYTADLLMVVVVLGLAGFAARGLYFSALYLELVVSGVLFVTFAASMFSPSE